MPLLQNLVGRRFGRLTVLKRAPQNSRANHPRWVCSCVCESTIIVVGDSLVSGHTRSCGCLCRQMTAARAFKDCNEQRFGRLVVLKRVGSNKHGAALWLCRCDCKNEVVVTRAALASGHTKSCGCLQRETRGKARLTHGMWNTREYHAYQAAKARCTNPSHQAFANYGGRGIQFLLTGIEPLIAKLGWCPPGRTFERIDNDGHYELDNLCWATWREQADNTRRSHKRKTRLSITPRRTQTAAECATEFNVPLDAVQALQARIRASQGAAL
jgi:hypothetical protein